MTIYFVDLKPEGIAAIQQKFNLAIAPLEALKEEVIYRISYLINQNFYAATGEKRAFVLSHGKNLLVLKMVGYGDDVVRYYQLENLLAHVFIGHHRYPTKGRVWHPGGAHPFIGFK